MGDIKKSAYLDALEELEHELVSMSRWAKANGERIVVIFEGRDTAGKGGAIKAIHNCLNPRQCRVAALPKPSEEQQGQWYFQRYVEYLPTKGDITLFDRSWYNRAGVEKVMGWADDRQVADFFRAAPVFEKMLVDDGIRLIKYWLSCDQAHQEERFKERLDDPLKRWKLSSTDVAARSKYADYTAAREAIFAQTHTGWAPWTVVDFNDQKLGRLTLIRDLLDRVPDTHVPPDPIDWGDLGHAPLDEDFGRLQPIPNYPIKD